MLIESGRMDAEEVEEDDDALEEDKALKEISFYHIQVTYLSGLFLNPDLCKAVALQEEPKGKCSSGSSSPKFFLWKIL